MLRPLLFLTYVNDLYATLSCDYEAYVDDIKLFRRIDNHSDQLILQRAINTCVDWCEQNGLSMNPAKCLILTITRQINIQAAEYKIKGIPLKRTECARDLGVLVDSRLKFDQHIENIVKKASKMLGFVIRICRKFRNVKSIIQMYNSLVRSQLEYCSTIWSPMYTIHAEKIENIQHRFTRFIYKKFHYPDESYENRVMRLGLTTLIDRRIQTDIMTLHDIIHYKIDCDLIESINFKYNRLSLRAVEPFELSTTHTNLGQNAPIYRLCSSYNEQFNDVDIFLPRNVFVRKIKNS